MPIIMNKQHNPPAEGGDFTRYNNAGTREDVVVQYPTRSRFVDGMANTPKNHKDGAVTGVYSKNGGFGTDLRQCLTNKGRLVGAQAGSFTARSLAFSAAYLAAELRKPGLSKIGFMENLVSDKKRLHRYIATLRKNHRMNAAS